MEIVTIFQEDHASLRTPAQEVSFPLDSSTLKLIESMKDFLCNKEKGVGLAAPQIGEEKRIILYQVTEDVCAMRKDAEAVVPLSVLINPTYEPLAEEGFSEDWEVCFSVPGMMGKVKRYNTIRFSGYTVTGEKIDSLARGFLARLLQHEIGHLNGEIYRDLIPENGIYGPSEVLMPIRMQEIEEMKKGALSSVQAACTTK